MADDIDPRAQEAFAASRLERDRTLEAVRRLESALAMASRGSAWLDEVTTDLEALEAAMSEEHHELNRPDALLAHIAWEHPRRFGSRIKSLREQYDDITRQVASLLRQLETSGADQTDPTDIRHRSGSIIRAIHDCRARQTDLVYEALRLDLGER